MSIDPEHVLHDALRLSPTDRAVIVGKLIESLDETVDEDVEAAWAVEIEKRLRDIDSGAVKPIPWDEARRQIRGSIHGSTTD